MHVSRFMARCESCGNEYDRLMRVEKEGVVHLFDCFECAVNKLAPACAHCGTRVIGHGVEVGQEVFCCAHCSKASGIEGLVDHVSENQRDIGEAAS